MTRLTRYLIAQILGPLAATTLALTAIVWMTQTLQRVEILVERGQSAGVFLYVTALLIPSLLAIITPLALFAAALYALNRLQTDSELVVIQAAGAGRWRIAGPLLFIACFGAMATLWVNLQLMPASYRAMKERIAEIRADIATGLLRSGEFSTPMRGVTFYAENVGRGGRFSGVLIHDARDLQNPQTIIAEQGIFRDTEDGRQLYFLRGNTQTRDKETGDIQVVRWEDFSIDVSEFQRSSGEIQLELTERYLGELLNPDLSNPWDRRNEGRLIAEGHARLASALYNFAYVLIALVAILGGAHSRRGYGRRIMLAVGAAIAMRILGVVAQSSASETPALNPVQYAAPLIAIAVCAALLGPPRFGGRVKHPAFAGAAA